MPQSSKRKPRGRRIATTEINGSRSLQNQETIPKTFPPVNYCYNCKQRDVKYSKSLAFNRILFDFELKYYLM